MEGKPQTQNNGGSAKIRIPKWALWFLLLAAVWSGALIFLDMPLKRYFAAREWESKGVFTGKNVGHFQAFGNKVVRESIVFFGTYNQIVPLVLLSAAAAIALGSARWRMLGHLLLGLGICTVLVWLGKFLVARQRPRWSSALHWQETFKGFWPRRNAFELQSLPSGDAALAFTVSFVLARYFPKHRWILLVLATGCAATRMIRGYHYFSDVLLGCFIGWLAAHVVSYLSSAGGKAPAGK
jgi:membrane-associated phospholipid phosphatase